MNHNSISELEESLESLESMLGINITIIDRDGIFRYPGGIPLFGKNRQSHRTNRVCDIGFCRKCVDHCRYEINEQGERLKTPFVHCCWKGIRELVIPLIINGSHYGSLFAGIWRNKNIPETSKSLPGKFMKEYLKLSEPPEQEIADLTKILTVFCQGMLKKLDENFILNAKGNSRKIPILRFLRLNTNSKTGLKDLAAELYLSPSRTSHLVKELFGTSFQELIKQERIERAKLFLRTTDRTAGEIASLVGFSDEYHFNRTFKAATGLPPGKYRQQILGLEKVSTD
jgi:AraC-like DNA-binding protein